MNHGRGGVVFSSGFFGFYAHGGFLSALRELGIEATGFSGASSGAIVAAMAASGMGPREIKDMLFGLKKRYFWDPDPFPLVIKAAFCLFKGYTGYVKGWKFMDILRRLPVKSFEECKRPLVVVATNITENRGEIFTSGPLSIAVAASGAVPGLFKPVEIGGKLYVDGGLVCKAPVMALAQETGPEKLIVHYITSSNLEKPKNFFLKKKFTPWHIHEQAVSIARERAYKMEVALTQARGIEVVEVRTKTPTIGPGSLDRGPEAYYTAKAQTLQQLKSH
ncbi:MAG TPA: hypothetical protein EYP06_05035 [Desulfobacterales bacterium]|nr:hypothetical protein [Desulfobacterales bacterium]